MTLQQLKYVLTIAEEGSFSAAARKLFLAQPSLSAMVRSLEDELGITIFDRSTRSLQITEDGLKLISYANQMTDCENQLREAFHQKAAAQRFSVSSQHYTFVCEAFQRLIQQETADSYSFRIDLTRTEDVINNVATLKSDIGILYLSEHGGGTAERTLERENIRFHPLRSFPVCAFMHEDHPLAGKESVTFSDLSEYPAIVYEQKGSHRSFSEEVPFVRVTPAKQVVVTDLHASMIAMDSCLAYDIGTGYVTEKERTGTKHVAVPVKNAGALTVGWIVPANLSPSPLIKSFVALLEEEIEKG